MSNLTAFFAYAAHPREIGEAIERAVGLVNERGNILVRSWTALDIVGQFISGRVLEGIDNADILIADISVLNFNVTYEIGCHWSWKASTTDKKYQRQRNDP